MKAAAVSLGSSYHTDHHHESESSWKPDRIQTKQTGEFVLPAEWEEIQVHQTVSEEGGIIPGSLVALSPFYCH